ncbi:MAG: hypothetical protein RL386_2074 [Bacteroidota bacterium]
MGKHHQIIIIGAGTAGITVAAQLLLKEKTLDIAIIDPARKHYYQPAWTLVGAGTFSFKATERDMAGLIPPGCHWVQEAVESVMPERNEVSLTNGDILSYDYLVVCPGVKNDYSLIEGLGETINKNGVCSNYSNPEYTWELLQEFKDGTALFTQPATPIKCGGAPQKILYLADDYWRKKGVRKNADLLFLTPGSVIFGVEPFKTTLMKVVDRKEIALRYFHKIIKVDGAKKTATFQVTAHQNEPERLFYHNTAVSGENYARDAAGAFTQVEIPFDFLHLAPPETAPDFIRNSPLAVPDGPDKGWMAVNIHSLQHKSFPNIFGLGDVAALPTAKTGAAVRKQAPVVVENIFHLIHKDGVLSEEYSGYSSCPLVTGYGKMLLAEFGYENKRMSDPLLSRFFDTSKELYPMWLLKKYGLPFMYWNLMLKGRA